MTGELSDLAGIFLQAGLPDMGVRPRPGASGEEIIEQACARCHHDSVDSGLSRSHFRAMQLDSLTREIKDRAIQRLQLPPNDPRSMPPVRSFELTTEERQLVIDVLAR